MSYLGVDFDCSSKGEIESLIRLKVATGRILFANPNKQASHIKYCSDVGVNKLVFDNENELIKIKQNHPNAKVLLRIKCDCLPAKFGADRDKSIKLIKKSIELGVDLVGISFYVGFRQKSAANIIEGIKNARFLFDYARENCDYRMHVLDIGGGYPGTWQTLGLFDQMADQINAVLDEYFPAGLFNEINQNTNKFEIIAELGTYFTTSSYTLCISIISKQELELNDEDKQKIKSDSFKKVVITGEQDSLITDRAPDCVIEHSRKIIYCVNDSCHAAFKWYDLNESMPIFSSFRANPSTPYFFSHIAGATCDSRDFILKDCYVPDLECGEYLIFRNMGSYTKTGATYFNDIVEPKTIFVSSSLWERYFAAFDEIDFFDGLIYSDNYDDVYKNNETDYKRIIENIL